MLTAKSRLGGRKVGGRAFRARGITPICRPKLGGLTIRFPNGHVPAATTAEKVRDRRRPARRHFRRSVTVGGWTRRDGRTAKGELTPTCRRIKGLCGTEEVSPTLKGRPIKAIRVKVQKTTKV